MNRREFLISGGALACAGCMTGKGTEKYFAARKAKEEKVVKYTISPVEE